MSHARKSLDALFPGLNIGQISSSRARSISLSKKSGKMSFRDTFKAAISRRQGWPANYDSKQSTIKLSDYLREEAAALASSGVPSPTAMITRTRHASLGSSF